VGNGFWQMEQFGLIFIKWYPEWYPDTKKAQPDFAKPLL